MTTILNVLKSINLGERVAEDEASELQKYFVKTDQWEQLYGGNVDIVYGPKGSGKSALYTSLNNNRSALKKKKIILVPAENVQGATVFRTIIGNPPPTELSFIYLWKLYILVLIGKIARQEKFGSDKSKSLIDVLERADLLPPGDNLSTLFRSAREYIKKWISRDTAAVEYAISVDPNTGIPTLTRRTEFRNKTDDEKLVEVPIDDLLNTANSILAEKNQKLWIVFDRLDVAFADAPDLERNAIRALFRAYIDIKSCSNIFLKIFVRDDIWSRITQVGFVEASHITKSLHIKWSEDDLLNLLMLRIVKSETVRRFYSVKIAEVKRSYEGQKALFYAMFPAQIDTGRNPQTMRWIISRTSDTSQFGNPREVIHLVDVARQEQIKSLEQGGNAPPGKQIFDRAAIKGALPLVSKVFYEQTILAEYPEMRKHLELLDGEKTTQNSKSLSQLWGLSISEASDIARRMSELGIFEIKGKRDPEFTVPFLLRPALNMVRGRALS